MNAQLRDAPGLHGPADFDNATAAYLEDHPINEIVGDMAAEGDAAWLFDAIEHAMQTGDAVYLLSQCRKHIEPVAAKAARARQEAWRCDRGEDMAMARDEAA